MSRVDCPGHANVVQCRERRGTVRGMEGGILEPRAAFSPVFTHVMIP